jgi:hypothetical protein
VLDREAGSRRSAVIVRGIAVPAPLERLRRRSVEDANSGMPAHVTLLYPVIAEDRTERWRLTWQIRLGPRVPR